MGFVNISSFSIHALTHMKNESKHELPLGLIQAQDYHDFKKNAIPQIVSCNHIYSKSLFIRKNH